MGDNCHRVELTIADGYAGQVVLQIVVDVVHIAFSQVLESHYTCIVTSNTYDE